MTGWLVVLLVCTSPNTDCRVKIVDGHLWPSESICLDHADKVPGAGCTQAQIVGKE